MNYCGIVLIPCILALHTTAAVSTPLTIGNGRFIDNKNNPSSVNCTWIYHTQPLDHFSPGATNGAVGSFDERVCIYSNFVTTKNAPVLFYVGNESPVEEYINNTGLMWTLGQSLGAHLVFAEHRYFGKSVPQLQGVPNCLSYCTSAQALADYAVLVRYLKHNLLDTPHGAVVAFGGSYGGMLAAWARFKYPTIFNGAIAGSAPIWGFPSDNVQLDGSMIPVTRSASAAGGATDTCKDNILSAWPVMREVGKSQKGRDMLADAFQLCPTSTGESPLNTKESVEDLIQFGHSPWFELAEGDYPFPSNYITYAVASTPQPLPAWPVRVACKAVGVDLGIHFQGNVSDVKFDIVIDGGAHVVHVDWNVSATTSTTAATLAQSATVQQLMRGLSDGLSVWYNVSGDKTCYHLNEQKQKQNKSTTSTHNNPINLTKSLEISDDGVINTNVCTADSLPAGNAAGWGVLCCNENLNLVNTLVSGVGNDMFWPPSVSPRNWNRTEQIEQSFLPCAEQYATMGLYGVPATSDPFATWESIYYGGLEGPMQSSNIVFSNGLLDPWTAAGVVHNISDTVVSVILDLGGHHLDLFFPNANDPPCAVEARKIEKEHVERWIREHNEQHVSK
jgi:lysosomal Pro-X carboxypeptidase